MRKNQFPAVDLGLSVSRVGGKAQNRTLRGVSGNLRVTLSQFEELEDFARFGTRLDNVTRARLARGSAVRTALRQAERDPMPALEQLAVLVAAMEGLFDQYSEQQISRALRLVRDAAQQKLALIEQRIADNETLQDDDRLLIVACAREALVSFDPTALDVGGANV